MDANIKVTFNKKVVNSLDIFVLASICCTNDGANTNRVFVNQVNAFLGINDPSFFRAVDVLGKVIHAPGL